MRAALAPLRPPRGAPPAARALNPPRASDSLLAKCLETDGVHLIEVPIDYDENHKVLSKR